METALPYRRWRQHRLTQRLDENGLPVYWRHEPPNLGELAGPESYWSVFEQWCSERGLRSFLATSETVLRFLCGSVGREPHLYQIFDAINTHHDVYYWHTAANPIDIIRHIEGVYVDRDQQLHIPPTAAKSLAIPPDCVALAIPDSSWYTASNPKEKEN